jgi:hypothetical protein
VRWPFSNFFWRKCKKSFGGDLPSPQKCQTVITFSKKCEKTEEPVRMSRTNAQKLLKNWTDLLVGFCARNWTRKTAGFEEVFRTLPQFPAMAPFPSGGGNSGAVWRRTKRDFKRPSFRRPDENAVGHFVRTEKYEKTWIDVTAERRASPAASSQNTPDSLGSWKG